MDLNWFDQIVPCGLSDKGVTSISKETQKQTSPHDVIPHLEKSFESLFQKSVIPVEITKILPTELLNKLLS